MDSLMDVGYYENPIPKGAPDPNKFARFYYHSVPVKNDDGELIEFKNVLYVEIRCKGHSKSSFSRPKRDHDEIEFKQYWEAFKANNADCVTGTPLRFLPGVGPADVDNFKAVGILSVEDMATLQESALDKIRGSRTLKARAQAWLAAIEAAKPDQSHLAPKNAEIKRKGRPPKVKE